MIDSIDAGASISVQVLHTFDTDTGFELLKAFSSGVVGRSSKIINDFHNQLKIVVTVTGGNATFKLGFTVFDLGTTAIMDIDLTGDIVPTTQQNALVKVPFDRINMTYDPVTQDMTQAVYYFEGLPVATLDLTYDEFSNLTEIEAS